MKFQNTGFEKPVIREYKNIRQPYPLFYVSKLEDPRIVPAKVRSKGDHQITVTMPDLSYMGFSTLAKMSGYHNPLKLIEWTLQLFDDLVEHNVVPIDIHDSNIMSDGKSLVLVDYEQFWSWDRNREAYGRWRMDQQIKVWAKKPKI